MYNSKSKIENNSILSPIINRFDYFTKKTGQMTKNVYKDQVKILKIVDEILKFNEQVKWGQGLKILTPDQMPSRLPFFNLIKSER